MIFLIARVSDVEQRKALPAQKQKLLDYAAGKGWAEGKDYTYLEFDETAYKEDRKKFRTQVIDPLLDSKEQDIVVFDKIDRFTRDASSEERSILTKLFRHGKLELHFPSDNLFIYKDSPAADLFRLDIGIALAGYYSSAIRDNVKRRFDQKLNDGEWPGRAPIGYKNIVIGKDSKGDDIRDIDIDADREHYILKGYELRSSGMSYEAIAKQMKEEGLRSKTKLNKPITRGQWEEILDNPFYYGEMRYDGQIYSHRYKPIVARWLWDRCQEVKHQRSSARTHYNSKEFMFKGLECAHCGYTITTDRKKDKYNLMKCTEYGGKHDAKWVNEDKLLIQVKDVFASVKVPKEVLPDIVAEIERDYEGEQEHYNRNVARLRKEYDVIDEDIKALFKDRRKFKLRPELFEELVADYEQQQKDILQQLEDHGKADKLFVVTASYILDVASRANELFDAESSKVGQKRYLINFVLSNLQLDGEKLLFNLKEPFDAIAAMTKSGNWLTTIEEVITAVKQDLQVA